MDAYKNYQFKDDNAAEQHNTLVMLDEVFKSQKFKHKPEFILCGGTALLFQGVIAVATIDIDTANKLTDDVAAMVTPFVSDAAADVILLPKNYKQRLVIYDEDLFQHMEIKCLSLEDIVVTKLYAWRHKDKEDLIKTSLLDQIDKIKVKLIIMDELDDKFKSKLLARFEEACDKRSLQGE